LIINHSEKLDKRYTSRGLKKWRTAIYRGFEAEFARKNVKRHLIDKHSVVISKFSTMYV
jgi:hypothetical protein